MPNQEISLDELHARLSHLGKDEIVLDVREPSEYTEGHVPGSMNISHTLVGHQIEKLKSYKVIYIHCKAGGRARSAYNTLSAKGFTNLVCISDAGMDAWKKRGYPVEK
jgi:phage shock protein E